MLQQAVPCKVCSSPTQVVGELPHTTAVRCTNKDCRCQFAVGYKKEAERQDVHSEMRVHGIPDSPDLVFKTILDRLESQVKGRRLLDFGAGGAFLSGPARKYGYDYTGVEFDPVGREQAMRERGVELYPTLDDLPEGAKYDLIVMSEVIEHLPDPLPILCQVRSRLADQGILYLSTPNVEGLRARMKGLKWEMYAESHVFYFTDASLRRLFKDAGFSKSEKMRLYVQFPNHSLPRQMLQKVLLTSGLDGGHRFICHA